MDLESLQQLNEAQLRQEILIPLFRAMGFKDVRLWHGGIMEQGKDIVMWKLGDLGERENYAVVVLAERLSGKATGQNSAGKVATQIQQAFATKIRDETTATELGVDKVWVVASHEITKEAQESVANVIFLSHLHLLTRFISGDKLAALISEHLPISGAVLHLQHAADVLQHSDPKVAIGFALSKGKKLFWFEGKAPDGEESDDIVVKYKFDDSAEGQALQAQWEKQSITGESVTIPTKYISEIDGSDLVKKFLLSIPAITFKDDRLGQLLRLRMEVTSEERCVYSCDLQMRLRNRTEDGATFDNEDEPVPWKVIILFQANGQVHCQFRLWLKGLNAFQNIEQLRCQDALSKSTGIRLIDLATGFNLTGNTSIQMSGIEGPHPRWITLMEKLALIQCTTRIVIPVEFNGVSGKDAHAVEQVYQVVRNAALTLKSPLCMKVDKRFASELVNHSEKGDYFSFSQAFSPEIISLFGLDFDLGFSVLFAEKLIPTEKCVADLRERLNSNSAEQVGIEVVPKEGTEIQRIYPKWLPGHTKLPEHAEKAILALKQQIEEAGRGAGL